MTQFPRFPGPGEPGKCRIRGEIKMEEKEMRPRTGVAEFETRFEMRKHPRFLLELPVEYYRTNPDDIRQGRTANASAGGLMVYLPEHLEMNEYLRMKLFFSPGPEMNTVEMLTQLVWTENQPGKNGGYRSGVKIVEISADDKNQLDKFFNKLTEITPLSKPL